ncbi:MAG: 6,7-dimethyl-8-ribityllumazine synthase [Rhizobiales bacterium]|nr:6,7-dimethyl-8-ribityllumazine synthase [Hyphomicrobiales bacterium]
MHVLILEARFYDDLLDELGKGARQAIEAVGGTHETLVVPGALEIPGAIAMAAASPKPFDAYVALGVVIRGETSHYEIVSNESARGIMDLTVNQRLAIGNGILTVENADQAWRRAKVDDLNKGGGAAEAALAMAASRQKFS